MNESYYITSSVATCSRRQGCARPRDDAPARPAFIPDFTSGDIFDVRCIDREHGALVVVRPDQYIAHVLPLDGYDELATSLHRC